MKNKSKPSNKKKLDKIVITDEAEYKKELQKLVLVYNSLSNLKTKTSFIQNYSSYFADKMIMPRLSQFLEYDPKDVKLSGHVYFRLFKVSPKDDSYKTYRVSKDTKFKKNDFLVILTSDTVNTLCFLFSKREMKSKLVYKTLKEYINNDSELILMKSRILGQLKKDKSLRAKIYTPKKLIKLTNFKNPFTPISKISNQFMIFVECFKSNEILTLDDVLNLFSYLHDQNSKIDEKINKTMNDIFDYRPNGSKTKKSSKKK